MSDQELDINEVKYLIDELFVFKFTFRVNF